jgi:hypothetical protein
MNQFMDHPMLQPVMRWDKDRRKRYKDQYFIYRSVVRDTGYSGMEQQRQVFKQEEKREHTQQSHQFNGYGYPAQEYRQQEKARNKNGDQQHL